MGGDPKDGTYFLGIEGGGTHTVALLADTRGQIRKRFEVGPLNLKLASDTDVLRRLREIKSRAARRPLSLALCLAGCRTAVDRRRLHSLAERIWPRVPVYVGNDLDSGFAAAFGLNGTGILVVSGTGSCVQGRNGKRVARAGGWGHLLGDHGSGYWIALTGLRAAVRENDRRSVTTPALRRVLRRLCLNSLDELVDWIQRANKAEVASLASEFLDEDGSRLTLQAASFLAMDCEAVARKVGLASPDIALVGGLLTKHKRFRTWVTHRLRMLFPRARIFVPKRESAVGALLLAGAESAQLDPSFIAHSSPLSLTEQRNPRTMDLDKRPVSRLVDTMLDEEACVIPALQKNKRVIVRTIKDIVRAFRRGGRLFYVGAGTSGRLGVLDASECPPTFSTDPETVQAIIAGGATALYTAVEGAEDDPVAGAEAVRVRGVGRRDIVIGIAASGSTPFVLGALDEAKQNGARTFLLCFSPPRSKVHTPLFFRTGPEAITGSTRLKAGTGTKLVLNMLTTISMIRLGKVVSNLMVDMKPTNEKLRARACRIVATLKGCREEEARRRLHRSHWNVKKALR
jgi:N-acetylmuramic acid 6-phosphate etherase